MESALYGFIVQCKIEGCEITFLPVFFCLGVPSYERRSQSRENIVFQLLVTLYIIVCVYTLSINTVMDILS